MTRTSETVVPLQKLLVWLHKAGMVGRGKPLKENKGKRWSHTNAKRVSLRNRESSKGEVISLTVLNILQVFVVNRDL